MEALIQLLLSIAPMSEGLLAHLRTIIKKTEYKKGEFILREGDVCNSIFYIERGDQLVYEGRGHLYFGPEFSPAGGQCRQYYGAGGLGVLGDYLRRIGGDLSVIPGVQRPWADHNGGILLPERRAEHRQQAAREGGQI